ncbi:MAG: hypothetical protein ACLRVN_02185 [Butyricicoccus sp.]
MQAVVITSSDPSHAVMCSRLLKRQAGVLRVAAGAERRRLGENHRGRDRITASVWYRSALCATMTAATPR